MYYSEDPYQCIWTARCPMRSNNSQLTCQRPEAAADHAEVPAPYRPFVKLAHQARRLGSAALLAAGATCCWATPTHAGAWRLRLAYRARLCPYPRGPTWC